MSAVLVIKLGALGDFIHAMGAMQAVRRHHARDRLVLLTTAPFADLARASGLFDEVWVDGRPRLVDVVGWLALRRRLRGGGFRRVYDLQTSDRTGFYFRLFWPGPRPEWSGIARGCSHPDRNPARSEVKSVARLAAQLAVAGIADVGPPDLSFLVAEVGHLGLARRYALLIPGSAPHRPEKRWPAAAYGALAGRLAAAGLRPVVVGAGADAAAARAIRESCPEALDLVGRTSLAELASAARGAAVAVGNDTGPMHLAVYCGCPTVALHDASVKPHKTAPEGEHVTVLVHEPLAALPVDRVAEAALRLARGEPA